MATPQTGSIPAGEPLTNAITLRVYYRPAPRAGVQADFDVDFMWVDLPANPPGSGKFQFDTSAVPGGPLTGEYNRPLRGTVLRPTVLTHASVTQYDYDRMHTVATCQA